MQGQSQRPHQPPQTAPQPPPSPVLRSLVQLNYAHAHKVYFSGPLIHRIERLPDGFKAVKDEGWTDIWAQLAGSTLSTWVLKDCHEASKQGKEVPPSYINITDAFVQILGSVTVPATPTTPPKRYTNVLILNTAGSNLYLFSCQTTAALISWAAAFRLAAWEKSRLEEIYTAHLIRLTLKARAPTTLIRGKMEGWARVRIAGQTDWKKFWVVVQDRLEGIDQVPSGPEATLIRKKRVSNIFSSKDVPPASSLPPKPIISMFLSPKPKDRRRPALSISGVTQAFAVYPYLPELIGKSTLIKVEGTFGDEEGAARLRAREGWASIIPEIENNTGHADEILKWVVALHDAFGLYGRPEAWTWDPLDSNSLMYGYPVGPQRETLFLDREIAENMDPREERTSLIRAELKRLLQQHMQRPIQVVQNPPVNPQQTTGSINKNGALPPLPPPDGRSTPISGTQRGSIATTHGRSNSADVLTASQSPTPLPSSSSVLGGDPISQSPPSGYSIESAVPLQKSVLVPPPAPITTTPASASSSVPNSLATTQKFLPTLEAAPFVPGQPAVPAKPVSIPSVVADPRPSTSLSSSEDDYLKMIEPGALYYIQHQQETAQKQRAIQQPESEDEDEDDKSSLDIAVPTIPKDPAGMLPREHAATIQNLSSDADIDINQAPPMSFAEPSSTATGSALPLQHGRLSPNRSELGREPSLLLPMTGGTMMAPMNPMMMSGNFPGMMGGGFTSPQLVFATQQAAQAYQQAMLGFSSQPGY